MLEFNCPHCSQELRVDPELKGQTGTCNHCGGKIAVPGAVTDHAVPRSRKSLVGWAVWGFSPAILILVPLSAMVLLGSVLSRNDMSGLAYAIALPAMYLFPAGAYGGPIILYFWGVSLLKSLDRKPIDAYVLAVPLAVAAYGINIGIVLAGCSMMGVT